MILELKKQNSVNNNSSTNNNINTLFSPITVNEIEFQNISNDNKEQLLSEAFAILNENNGLIHVNDISYLLFKVGFSPELIMQVITRQNKKLFKSENIQKSTRKDASSWSNSIYKVNNSNDKQR